MDFATASLIHEQINHEPSATVRTGCPVCDGLLFEARGTYRCCRCHYSFCASCGGDDGEPVPEGD